MSEEKTFIITKEWIKKHGTKGIGFSGAQHRAIGSDRKSGWQDRLDGKAISEAQKLAFESSRTQKGTIKQKKKPRKKRLEKDRADLLKLVSMFINELDDKRSITPGSLLHDCAVSMMLKILKE